MRSLLSKVNFRYNFKNNKDEIIMKYPTKQHFGSANSNYKTGYCIGELQKDLAKEYNVTHGTIWFIANDVTHTRELNHRKKKKINNIK